jgi:hypothetical protein
MTQDGPDRWRAIAGMGGLYAALASAAVAWILWRSGADGLRALAGDGWAGAGAGAGLAAGVVLLGGLAARSFRWYAALESELRAAIGPLTAAQIVVLALASGVAEELFFRGALQGAVGWVAAGLAFGILHLPMKRALVAWMLLATGLGLGFGYVAMRLEGILGVTVAHAGINAANLWRLCGGGGGAATGRP